MPTKRLPNSADIKHLKNQAKDLLRQLRNRKLSAFQRIREFHPRFSGLSDAVITQHLFSLSDAQLSIAREYGYANWPRLKAVIAERDGCHVDLIHNDRITDPLFLQALDFLDEGNDRALAKHLTAHPKLVHQQVIFEGDNYFTNPTLIEFVAENPIRQGQIPANIVGVARVILEAGASGNQEALNSAVMLVASGRLAREFDAQEPLIGLLCDYGADPAAGLSAAVGEGEFAAARLLIARGAPLDLPVAAALDMRGEVANQLGNTTKEQLQLGLSLSALHGRRAIVEILLHAGADPNLFNPPGGHSHCTPLHSAAFAGHLETVKALTKSGARCDIGDIHRGATAVAWAEHAGHDEIARYLTAKG